MTESDGLASGLQRRIAEHNVQFLEENDGEWQMAEKMGYGSVEVDIVDRETVLGYFGRDPVDLKPVSEHDIWEQVELDDKVEVFR